jgi:hypothetical protein
MRKLAILGLLALFPLSIFAATLTLRDGTVFDGHFIRGNTRTITFRDTTGVVHTIGLDRIQSIDFGGTRGTAASPYNEANRMSGEWTLPAGTQIAVRTNETIDSGTASEGQTYSAAIAQNVVDPNGNILIPQGSNARLVIRRISSGGLTGSPTLAVDLQSVEVNGRRYIVNANAVQRSGNTGIGKNKRTAELVGGGAALGTLIGAIAGGGTGAAIGAATGAVGGGATQVLTRGKQVRVSAETVLTFRLDRLLDLQPA